LRISHIQGPFADILYTVNDIRHHIITSKYVTIFRLPIDLGMLVAIFAIVTIYND